MPKEVEFSDEDIKKALRRPNDFGMYDEEGKFFKTWALGPVIVHRDSGLTDQSNAACLLKMLEAEKDIADDWEVTEANHWAVGWVKHLSYRVIDSDGKPTKVAKLLKAWFDALADYPIADEHDLGERQMQAEWDNVKDACLWVRNRKSDFEATDENVNKVLDWLNRRHPCGLEASDDQGFYPDSDEMKECFAEFGWLETEGE